MTTLRLNPAVAAARRAARRAAQHTNQPAIVAPAPTVQATVASTNKHDRLKAELDALEANLSRAMDALRTIDSGMPILLKDVREVLVKASVIATADKTNQYKACKSLIDALVEKGLVRRENETSTRTSSILLIPVGWASFDGEEDV